MRAVLIDTNTGNIIRRANYPRWDMQPVSDPQPGEEWLLCVEGGKPALNAGEKLVSSEGIGVAHPDYPHLRTWLTSYRAEPLNTEELAAADAERKQAIKAEAQRRIEAIFPPWKQRNMIAYAVESLNSGQPVAQALLDSWSLVKAIRAHSDALEANPAATADDGGWPA